jgi:hypothetical protein
MSNNVKEHQVLNDNQLAVIGSLIAGKTQRESAQLAGVTEETVCRWKRDNLPFLAELNRQRATLHEGTIAELYALRQDAIKELGDIVRGSPSMPVNTRLQAIKMVLAMTSPVPVGKTTVKELETDRALDDMFSMSFT